MFSPDIFVPGLRLKMVALSSLKSKFVTYLIGYKVRKYLVVERPLSGGVPARLEQGTEWSVNFVHQGQIYGFNTQILGASAAPVPLTFLGYPESVERTELRQSQRYPVQLATVFRPETQDGGPFNGVIVDISEGGCLMAATVGLPAGSSLSLQLDLPTQGEAKGLTAEIKSLRGQEGRYLMGLCFTDFGDDGYPKLKAYIESLRAMALRI